jgi:hypothetical protein
MSHKLDSGRTAPPLFQSVGFRQRDWHPLGPPHFGSPATGAAITVVLGCGMTRFPEPMLFLRSSGQPSARLTTLVVRPRGFVSLQRSLLERLSEPESTIL